MPSNVLAAREMTCLLSLRNLKRNRTDSNPVVVIENIDDIATILALNCTCDGKKKNIMAISKLDNNTFVTFEMGRRLTNYFGDSEPNLATVFVKRVPKLKALRDLIYSITYFENRKLELKIFEKTVYNYFTIMCKYIICLWLHLYHCGGSVQHVFIYNTYAVQLRFININAGEQQTACLTSTQ